MMAAPDVARDGDRVRRRAGLPARRLLATHAAEAHGGDVRGRQSAALLVVPPRATFRRPAWDLRVDDDAELPLVALDRFLDLHDADELATLGDDLTGRAGDEAGTRTRASALAPGNHELLFWAGLAAAQAGDMPLALERARWRSSCGPGWRSCPEAGPGHRAERRREVLEALGRG